LVVIAYPSDTLAFSTDIEMSMHVLFIGMYIAPVSGLYAPDGWFLPPRAKGHAREGLSTNCGVESSLMMGRPVCTSTPVMTFW